MSVSVTSHYVIHECYYVAHQQPTLHKLHTSVSDNHYVIHECYYVAHQQPTLHKLHSVSDSHYVIHAQSVNTAQCQNVIM